MKFHNPNQLNYANISRYKVMLRFLLTWLFIIAIFLIIFSRINFIEVVASIKQTDTGLFCIGIIFSLFAHVFFSSVRYQKVLSVMGCRISFLEAVIIRMGCNPIKGILPFKVGEFAIIAYLKKKHNLSYSKGFISLFFGYAFSFILLMLFYALGGIFYFHDQTQRIFFAGLLLIILLLIIPLSIPKFSLFIAGYLKKFQGLPEEIRSLLEKYNPGTINFIFLHSLGIEGSKLLIILILLKSLGINISFDALLLFGSTTIIAAYLPITYWGMGIRESAILFLFSGYAPPDKLLAGSLLITFVDGLLPVVLGLFFIRPFLNILLESKKTDIDIASHGA